MKAISFYSTSELDSARSTFVRILNLNEDVTFDPVQTSPKIIEYFNSVKEVFLNIRKSSDANKPETSNKESIENRNYIQFNNALFTKSISRSLLLPGLGHITAGSETKGWLLTSIGTVNLGAMIYYIFDTNDKEKSYLNETVLSEISSKYNSYNESYKMRNILIGTFTAIWVYAQLDLLFNKDELFLNKINPSITITPEGFGSEFSFQLSIQL